MWFAGCCHFQRPTWEGPHMCRVATPPKRSMPAVMAPFVVVLAGVRNPDSDPANLYRCGWNSAKVIAAAPPWEAPTIACPPGRHEQIANV